MHNIRIGQAVDIHQLVEGRKLILGGVEIEHSKGLLGHSDADVLTHAIGESILGYRDEELGKRAERTSKVVYA